MEPGKAISLQELVKATKNQAECSTAELDVLIVGYLERYRRDVVYQGCTQCKRKVIPCEGLPARCEHCSLVVAEKFYYRLKLQVTDESELTWVTVWEPIADFLLGISAEEYNGRFKLKKEKVILDKLVGRQLRMQLSVAKSPNNKIYIRVDQIISMGGSKGKKTVPVAPAVEEDEECIEVSADFSPISAKHFQSWRRYTSGNSLDNPLFSVERSKGSSTSKCSVGSKTRRRYLHLEDDVEEIAPTAVAEEVTVTTKCQAVAEEVTVITKPQDMEGIQQQQTSVHWDVPSFVMGFFSGITLALIISVKLMWTALTSTYRSG